MTATTETFNQEGGEARLTELRSRTEELEQQLTDLQRAMQSRLIRSELKAEAIRAGMIDLDGLQLIDTSKVALNENYELPGAPALMAELRRRKPWLFGGFSSSSSAGAPPAQPPRPKLATEMTDEEYRKARAALLKRHR